MSKQCIVYSGGGLRGGGACCVAVHGILLHKSDHSDSWQWMMIGGITSSPHIIYLTQVLSLESMMRGVAPLGGWIPGWSWGSSRTIGRCAETPSHFKPRSALCMSQWHGVPADEGASGEDADSHEVWFGVAGSSAPHVDGCQGQCCQEGSRQPMAEGRGGGGGGQPWTCPWVDAHGIFMVGCRSVDMGSLDEYLSLMPLSAY